MSPRKKKQPLKSNLRQTILNILGSSNKSMNYKQIVAKLPKKDQNIINGVIKELKVLEAKGEVIEDKRGSYKAVPRTENLRGTIDFTRNGDAYLICEGEQKDLFIHHKNTGNALNGDTVEVRIISGRGRNKQEAKVIEVVNRAKSLFAGTLEVHENFAFLVADNTKVHIDFFIPKDKLKNGKNGQKALVSLIDWNDPKDSPKAEVVEVLGYPGDDEVERKSILINNGFPISFPKNVVEDANKIPLEISNKEIARRKDMREVTTFTIDPVDAKDFDDALSFQRLEDGWFEVGVHIADVSHYVKPNSALDKEARLRATSVYLVDSVIPMLPEVLSNNVCSLRPNEEKLCYSVVFIINESGNVKSFWVGETVIYSDVRFTYEEVQEIIEGKEHALKEELLTLNTMAQNLRELRFKKGGVLFDKTEVRFQLNEDNKPVGVFLKRQKEAHKLIEDFMLLANKSVAALIGKKKPGSSPKTFVYRVHDSPDPEKVSEFALFVKRFGYNFKLAHSANVTKSINDLLIEAKEAKESDVIANMAIRTMAKAVYSTNNIGHYGLGFDFYSHFTSPIRRYPDVLTHRLLKNYLSGGKSASQEQLEEDCKHSSEMEKQASEAERESTKYFQVLYMQDSVGKVFDGVVSGMNDFGIFVELIESKCEGMIRLKDIDGDYYSYDQQNFRVVAHNSQTAIYLGDEIKVEVLKADLVNKRLDFHLISINSEDAKT